MNQNIFNRYAVNVVLTNSVGGIVNIRALQKDKHRKIYDPVDDIYSTEIVKLLYIQDKYRSSVNKGDTINSISGVDVIEKKYVIKDIDSRITITNRYNYYIIELENIKPITSNKLM